MVGMYPTGTTGPLSFPEPLPAQRLTGPAPASATAASGPVAPMLPLTQNRTNTYPIANLAPVGFVLPVQPQVLIQNGIDRFDAMGASERAQLQGLATSLGFPSGRTLVHALRNLAPEQRAQWLATLPADSRDQAAIGAARTGLTAVAREAVENFFTRQNLPLPEFRGDSELWNAQTYLSIFNSMTEMKNNLPDEMFRKVVTPNGKQLTFERRQNPPEVTGGVMETFNSCMCIAHTDDANNVISLYDPAVSMDPRDIINRPDVQALMQRINQPRPAIQDINSFKELLNLGLPPNRHLKPDPIGEQGPLEPRQVGVEVWARLHEFQTVQMLKQSLDILHDDQQLSPADKRLFADKLKAQIIKVQQEGADDVAAVEQLMMDLGRLSLSPSGKERLQTLRANNPNVCSNQLRPSQLDLLVRNWFGMIDSGDQYDFTEQVINHEVGHLLQNQEGLMQNWSRISFRDQGGTEGMARTLDGKQSTWGVQLFEKFGLNFRNGFGSDYARVNDREDFAESFRMFTREPARLAKENPLKFVILAGVTGKYAGKERELIDFLRKQGGQQDLQLRNLVRILRGQNSTYVAQETKSYVDKGMGLLNTAANLMTPLLSMGRAFGLDPLGSMREAAGEKAADIARDLADAHTPQFDLQFSTLLPGLEGALGMQTQIRTILPDQPGYVLDWLRQQTANTHSSNPGVRDAARGTLERFARVGTDALPTEVRNQIPLAERQRFQRADHRAMMMVLAHISASPEKLRELEERLKALAAEGSDLNLARSEQALARGYQRGREALPQLLSPEKLEEMLGPELNRALPPAFKNLLREPGMLDKISGFFGRIDLDSGRIQEEVTAKVAEREKALRDAGNALLTTSGTFFNMLAGFCFSKTNDGFALDDKGQIKLNEIGVKQAQRALEQIFRDLNKGNEVVNFEFTPALAEEIIRGIGERMQAWQQGEGANQPLNTGNSVYKEQLQRAIQAEMLSRYRDKFFDALGVV